MFRAKVNGREVWALLDNQAQNSLISNDFVISLGVRTDGAPKPLNTAQGTSTMALTEPVEIVIPGQAQFRMPLFSTSLSGATMVAGKKVDLILGGDLFKGLGFSISPSNSSFSIGPSGAAHPPAPYYRVGLENREAQVKVMIGTEVLLLRIDLGFDGGVAVEPEVWKRLSRSGPRTKKHIMDLHGNLSAVDYESLPSVRLGNMAFHDVPVCNCPLRAGTGDGLVGMAIFRQASFVLDQGARALWIAPTRAPAK
ncbi:aspartyl protease family protein [Sphingomonas sp. RS6]